jgi:hypothetical protein
LFLASSEGIALHENVLDDDGEVINYRILEVNPAYERITGIPKDRAVGRLATEVYGTSEPPYLDVFTKVGATGEPASLETYFEPMGKHFFISISSPAKGQFNTIFIDMTERVRLERDLADAKSRAELYVDLLTHDISNYNTAAMGYLQLAEMRLKIAEKDRKLIAGPLQVLSYSSELIANVRDLKKVEAGRDKAQPVDVCDILEEVRDAYEDPLEREVTINICHKGDCWVSIAAPAGRVLEHREQRHQALHRERHRGHPGGAPDQGRSGHGQGQHRGQRPRHPRRAEGEDIRPLADGADQAGQSGTRPVPGKTPSRGPQRVGVGRGPRARGLLQGR